MTLAADVQARIPTSRLIQLTNLTSGATNAINTAALDAAVADTKAAFARYTGFAYDEANAAHTPIGVMGVIYHLCENKGLTGEAKDYRDKWLDALTRFAQTAGLRWVSPGTNAPYTPTVEAAGTRPDADRSRFLDLVPLPPGSLGTTLRRVQNNT